MQTETQTPTAPIPSLTPSYITVTESAPPVESQAPPAKSPAPRSSRRPSNLTEELEDLDRAQPTPLPTPREPPLPPPAQPTAPAETESPQNPY